MSRKKTFIIGAGASKELDLPTGGELTRKIEELCRFSIAGFGEFSGGVPTLKTCFRYMKRSDGSNWDPKFLAQVASKIRQNMSLAPSIDNFLAAHAGKEGWVDVGKLAIALSILKAENQSALWFNSDNIYNRPDFSTLPNNWLTELFRVLVAGRTVDDFELALANCRFVTFNYDRVIEHFFHQAISSYFEISHERTNELCERSLQIVHVYGSLGEISCSNLQSFGKVDDPQYICQAAQKIKVFTEGTSSQNHLKQAKSWIEDANVLLILGFGYLPLNLNILAPDEGKYSISQRLMTSKGVSSNNLDVAKSIFKRKWYGGIDYSFSFEDVSANELIWQNSFFLSEADG